ncbi:MAG: GMP reductase [Candidatus Woesearchaeota archaeon]|jgi:GMP reductase
MRIEYDTKLDFSDVLIRPKRSTLKSRKDVVLERTFYFIHSQREWTGVPIMTANMDTTGTFEMAKVLSKNKMITVLHKHYSIKELANFFKDFNEPDYISYSLGIRDEDFEKLGQIIKLGLDSKFNFVCLDVPNAYLECIIEHLRKLRELCPRHTIIIGNVVTNEMTEELLIEGADIVKIGIGSGSACTTRKQTGVGYPQLSAVIECADAAHGISIGDKGCGLIISDGGAVHPSCVTKAFCGGADFVMMGSMFAGFFESGGKLISRNGKKYKQYYGMSSTLAMEKHYGGVAKHRASEGRILEIPYKGKVQDFVLEVLGSLRSTGTYIGARKLKEFSRRATFIMVNRQLNTSLERFDVNN